MTDILTLAIALSVVLALRWGLSRLGETGAAMKACWDCGSLVTTQAPLPSILCSRCGGRYGSKVFWKHMNACRRKRSELWEAIDAKERAEAL